MATRSLNKVFLIGNLTRDPEIRYTSSGAAVCSFGMATNRSWKDSEGEIREEAEFHNLVSWNKMAEVCYQILAKGMKVYVEGELRNRSWEGDDGNTRYRSEIKLNEMILLDSKGKQGAGGGGRSGDDDKDKEVSVDDVMGKDKDDKKKEEKDEVKEVKDDKKEKEKKGKNKKDKAEKDLEDPLDDDLSDLPF
jgi:single-strand DNA-binding protein